MNELLLLYVERSEEEEVFTNDEAPHFQNYTRLLWIISNIKTAEKAVKHIRGFKDLLDHQQDNDLISEEAYTTLKTQADNLIEKWQ